MSPHLGHLGHWFDLFDTAKDALFAVEFLVVQLFLIYHITRALFFSRNRKRNGKPNVTTTCANCGSKRARKRQPGHALNVDRNRRRVPRSARKHSPLGAPLKPGFGLSGEVPQPSATPAFGWRSASVGG